MAKHAKGGKSGKHADPKAAGKGKTKAFGRHSRAASRRAAKIAKGLNKDRDGYAPGAKGDNDRWG